MNRILISLIVAGIVLVGGLSAILFTMPAPEQAGDAAHARPVQAGIEIGQEPFLLTDHQGRAVASEEFKDRFTLYYFGFTFCPDICPTTMWEIEGAFSQLPEDIAERFQVVFVSVDPERDTPEIMADFVSRFDMPMTGLTGSPDEIRAVARDFKVYYSRQPGETPDDPYYLVNHSGYTYMLDPDGGLWQLFDKDVKADGFAAAFEKAIRAWDAGAS